MFIISVPVGSGGVVYLFVNVTSAPSSVKVTSCEASSVVYPVFAVSITVYVPSVSVISPGVFTLACTLSPSTVKSNIKSLSVTSTPSTYNTLFIVSVPYFTGAGLISNETV